MTIRARLAGDRNEPDRRRHDRTDPTDRRTSEQVMPHSIDAERAVLGAILIDPTVFAVLPDSFSGASFYRAAHTTIFNAVNSLREHGSVVDLLTVKEELTRVGALDTCGGGVYLATLVDGVPRSSNAPHYADIIVGHATRRAVITLASQLSRDAYDAESTADELIDAAQRGVLGVSQQGLSGEPSTLLELITPALAALELATERKQVVIGTPTGFFELDQMTAGLQRGELSIMAARPSIGKTALALNIAAHAAATVGLVLVFSLEMTSASLFTRLAAAHARVEGHRIRTGHLSSAEAERVGRAMADISVLPIVVDDTSSLPVEDLRRRTQRVMLKHGAIALVIVDYLQLVGTRSVHENRTQQVSFVSRELKNLGKDLRVPVLALCQLSRAVETRRGQKPLLSDLRESGALEQDADLVMFIHRPDDLEATELIVAKQRNGPVGTVKVQFSKAYTRFENITTYVST